MSTVVAPVTFPPQRTLLGPGPSDVPARVLQALARPTIGHLDPIFLNIMDDLRAKLRQVFRTQNEMTLAVSGTGSAGMETLFVNLVEPGDKVLIGVNGVFGGRMVDVAERCGATVEKVEAPWGTVFDQDAIIDALKRIRPRIVALVHAETSTGAYQPVDRIGAAAKEVGALFLLDCVTSLAGAPIEIDAWSVDAAYSGTQKCLSCPPGSQSRYPLALCRRTAACPQKESPILVPRPHHGPPVLGPGTLLPSHRPHQYVVRSPRSANHCA